ncbi:hypothetical protein [Chitinophaga sedimenti]|nr:hypothetical protein [Chitinophaga sedimenti]
MGTNHHAPLCGLPAVFADDIIAPAQERYRATFDEWKGQYMQW